MKKIIFFLLSFFMAAHSFAQQIETLPPLTKQDYLTRSKQQKTAAWMLTGAGTAGLLFTSAAEVGEALGGGMISLFSLGTVEPKYKSYTVPYLLSAAALGTGVALFIASSKSKRKAREIDLTSFLKIERASVIQKSTFTSFGYPSLAIKAGF